MTNNSAPSRSAAPSHIYYFDVGAGDWEGEFTFRVTSWRRLRNTRSIGLRNRALVVAMALTQRLTGASRLESTIVASPSAGAFGVADNVVRISKFGVTLYLLKERYLLDPDGRGVTVEANEQFSPVPGILTRKFSYPAAIHPSGLRSTYHMPLLGSPWTATYEVGTDRQSLAGELVCDWAKATENARRAS
ncbi:hypothetical protein [Streptomyces sp. RerS4]|uniref:hypothetical protein n=1 Tax=Streptomyces sp. RerS4 TaxID=2942449 RepID=UPI00201BD4B1|nr:hypothetical protein [Streptomyces sp. RerS4]UQX04602.1 hypothetical protein M4D82_31880 [Streptomyces sp. RerS4]